MPWTMQVDFYKIAITRDGWHFAIQIDYLAERGRNPGGKERQGKNLIWDLKGGPIGGPCSLSMK